jgi:hypothetical protein
MAARDGALEPAFDGARTSFDEAAREAMPSSDTDSPGAQDADSTLDDEARPESGDRVPPMSWDGGGAGLEASSRDGSDDADDAGVARDTGGVRADAAKSDGATEVGGGLCTYGSPTNGTGSFTWYYFGQGTSQQNGVYTTACGYQGTESGMIDTVQNIAAASPAASSYFAAIPGSSGFSTVSACGACVEIVHGGTSIVATVIDECPTDNGQNPLCAQPGHLDLSYSAWKALAYPSGDPSGTTWKFVSCPVTGSITTRLKSGNADQLYIENTTFPVTSVALGAGPARHLSYGAWQLPNGAPAAGATLTLQDVEGHSVTIAVGSGGSTGEQFPDVCDGE